MPDIDPTSPRHSYRKHASDGLVDKSFVEGPEPAAQNPRQSDGSVLQPLSHSEKAAVKPSSHGINNLRHATPRHATPRHATPRHASL
jgi:hypothetical protein